MDRWEGEDGMNWEMRVDIYTLRCIKQMASGKLLHSPGSLAQSVVMIWRVGLGCKREIQEGGDICILTANSPCTAETHTTLQSNYTPIKD